MARQVGKIALAKFSGETFQQGILYYTGQEILPFWHGKLIFMRYPSDYF
jgi:hypothetical protein